MPRKTRKQIAAGQRAPFLTFYDDHNALWINRLCEEVEALAHIYRPRTNWQTPRRVYLQFSKKDPRKEAERREAMERQRSRAGSRR